MCIRDSAVSYAVVAYQTAWFKCHYTREYMAALLTSVLDNSDKVAGYILSLIHISWTPRSFSCHLWKYHRPHLW